MGATAAAGGLKKTALLYDSTIGKKAVMAVSGVVLCGFVLVHMLGNLQVFLGPEQLNHYAETLKANAAILWGARTVLLVAVVAHIVAAFQLAGVKRSARQVVYVKKEPVVASFAARTMMWSGPIVLAFIIYHLLHFTTGQAHPDFIASDVYRNVIIGFQNPAVALVYIAANIMLAIHLYHGAWSMFQTLGINHPKYTPRLKTGAKLFGLLIGIGNVSMPLAVLTGLVR